jgi:DNA invertase Pin-like site-specific DNA recombinase
MNGQNVQSQLDQLKASGATEIFQEKPVGTKCNMSQLDKLLADVQGGDTLVVTSLDRIAHNTKQLLGIVESLNAAGASLKVIDNGIDTSTTHGDVIRMVLAAIADFDRQVVRERQAMGIAKAKQEGRYKGRKPTAMAKADEVLVLNAQGLTRQKIADQLEIGVASVYRILKNQATSKTKYKKTQKKPVVKQKSVQNKPMHETARELVGEQLSFF